MHEKVYPPKTAEPALAPADPRWRCTYCGNVNVATAKACQRCGVIGIKAPVKSTSQVAFGVLFLVLLIGALLIGFL